MATAQPNPSRSNAAIHIGRTLSMRPPKILCHADVLNSTSHVGTKINVSERVHWVRIPSEDKDDIIWWPGIIYTGFLELMRDLDWRLSELRAGCLVNHNRTKATKPAIVYLIGPIPFAQSINYIHTPIQGVFGMDEAGRDGPDLKNYYDFYEEMTEWGRHAPSASEDRRKRFDDSVEFADRILCAADSVEADLGGKLLIENGVGQGVEQVMSHPAAAQAASREMASPVCHRSVSYHHSIPLKKVPAGGDDNGPSNSKKRPSATPETSALSPDSTDDMSTQFSSTSNTPWPVLWKHLQRRDWTYEAGKGLHTWYYVRPNCTTKKGSILGEHFFTSPDEIMAWLKRNEPEKYGIVSNKRDNNKRRHSNSPVILPSPMSDEKSLESDGKHVPSPLSEMSFGPAPVADLEEIENMIHNKECWNDIWKRLQKDLGWHWLYGKGLVDMLYIQKGKSDKDKRGEDYFESKEAVMEYILGRNERIVQDGESPSANKRVRKRRRDVKRFWGKE